jgi:hypothetical protein
MTGEWITSVAAVSTSVSSAWIAFDVVTIAGVIALPSCWGLSRGVA